MIKKKPSLLFLILITLSLLFSSCYSENSQSTRFDRHGDLSGPSKPYAVNSPYLKNPDLLVNAAEKTARFWERALDTKYGGYFTDISDRDEVIPKTNIKVSFIQSHNAYAFAKAFQLTGNPEFLAYGRKALDFLYQYAWDKEYGGWYQEMRNDGSLNFRELDSIPYNNVKWSFNQFNVLSGISAMYEATGNETDKAWLDKSYDILDAKLWDSRPGVLGYYDQTNRDWSSPFYKTIASINSTFIKSIESLYQSTSDDRYKNRVIDIADIINDNFVKSIDNRKFGMSDRYDSDWNALEAQTWTNVGNYFSPTWILSQAYMLNPDEKYRSAAGKLFHEVYAKGNVYDDQNGGFYSTFYPNTGTPTDSRKSWWTLADCVVSGLSDYYAFGESDYLKIADESLIFIMNHLYDQENGDFYAETDKYGENADKTKGSYWKDAYHSLDLFFYTYLYGNLILNKKSISLYYSFEADNNAREFLLKPFEPGNAKLEISGVLCDGKKYTAFDKEKLKLFLPAKTGGIFKVTFSLH
jgi:mannobiose 2-epimerase